MKQSRNKLVKLLVIATVLFLFVMLLWDWDAVPLAFVGIPYGLFSISLLVLIFILNSEIKKEEIENSALETIKNQYNRIRKGVDIPIFAKKISYINSSPTSQLPLANEKSNFFIWKTHSSINFFPCSPSSSKALSSTQMITRSLLLSKVESFEKAGEVFRETKISGGGGGGSSLSGAILGGLLAGGVGAIVGSRKKVNPVTSQLITHDTRGTVLNYFDKINRRQQLFFDIDAYQVFNDLIPDKEVDIVKSLKSSQIIQSKTQAQSNQPQVNLNKSVTDQLRELAKLRDEGIITEQEFIEKKKILLDKIK